MIIDTLVTKLMEKSKYINYTGEQIQNRYLSCFTVIKLLLKFNHYTFLMLRISETMTKGLISFCIQLTFYLLTQFYREHYKLKYLPISHKIKRSNSLDKMASKDTVTGINILIMMPE